MSLFQVQVVVTKEAVFYVEADTREEAQVDANELADGLDPLDFDEVRSDVSTFTALNPPHDLDEVWTGGPDGEFISGREFKERNDQTSNA